MANPVFKAKFDEAQRYTRELHVVFIPIEDPVELYFYEVFAVMELNTDEWNTFKKR